MERHSSAAARGLAQVVTLPPARPGFIGEGHTAIHVIDVAEFAHNDPFIILADDRLELPPGRRAGGPWAGGEPRPTAAGGARGGVCSAWSGGPAELVP